MASAGAALALVLGTGFFVGAAWARQERMDAALADLQSARSELQEALHDKGGHRVRALHLVNEAIDEVQAGIDAGDD